MNPFTIKAIDDFTIEDCETYLNSYPFGDHSIEVKERLKGLKKGTIKISAQKAELHKAAKDGVAQIVSAVQQERMKNSNRSAQAAKPKSNNHANNCNNKFSKPTDSKDNGIFSQLFGTLIGNIIIWLIGIFISIFFLDLLIDFLRWISKLIFD